MTNLNNGAEVDAIEGAYREQIQALFKILVTNIIADGNEKALARFTAGMNVAKQARQLALAAVGSPASAVAMMPRSKRAKGKRA
jgi:hypothetical protein